MRNWLTLALVIPALSIFLPSSLLRAQSSNATISGSVLDQSGAAVPRAEITLKAVESGNQQKQTSDSGGLFSFPNLQQGAYELEASATGFRNFVQKGITIHLNDSVRIPVALELGQATQTVEVDANASALNVETPEVKGTLTRAEIAALPLQVAGGQRSSAAFVTLLPGVSPGGGQGDAFQARFNGGQRFSDEATLDGVTMQEGLLSQSGMVAIHNDFPIAPEAVGEISVLTSNFDVQYGSSSAAVIVASTKEGTNQFHGGAYEYHRDTLFNARQWGVAKRSKDLENDFGVFLGGPAKLPGLWSSRIKTYFFGHFEGFRSVGSTNKPILTVPTAKMRAGDFSEWPNPIYDPDTTRANPAFSSGQAVGPNNLPYLRSQFMGCNGNQPNVICSSDPRLAGSLAPQFLKFVPLPNRPGTIANYESPNGLASALNANTDQWDARGDTYPGEKDHISGTYHYRGSLPFTQHAFPAAIDVNNTRIPNYSHVARGNWDHTFRPTLLNHFAIGFLNLPTTVYNSSDCCVSQLPQIAGVYNHKHESAMRFGGGYDGYGGNADFFTTRPTWALNDMMTWIHGKHSFHFGGEYRNVKYPTLSVANGSGTFNFSELNTGLRGISSGNAMASFLLGDVASASATFYTLPSFHPTGDAFGAFVGDTWKATNKLNVTVGLRWDVFRPSVEAADKTSFFDPGGVNPGAGGRLGRLAFAGNKYGAASYGDRHPEKTFHKAFAPRLGLAYSLTSKTVIRTGYGIFFEQNFYPGWNAGIATDGFNSTASFDSSLGGLQPAFLLQNGLPQNFAKPPFTDPSFLNGRGAPNYRPKDANQLPYTQQWNFSVEHEVAENVSVAVAYVGNKGTRLLSQINPINVLDPKLLSLGDKLYDEFKPGQTALDGVAAPYDGWARQMTGCRPSVAQALLPYPQYCGKIYGQNENVGNSTYHSLQVSAQKRFSRGLYVLTSYTFSKTLTSADSAQSATDFHPISPFERKRNKALADSDQPHVLAVSVTYELPFGTGKTFLNNGGFLNRVIGGWEVTSITRVNSGLPISFTSSFCNVPAQFAAGCLPAILPGSNPLAQSNGSYDPRKPRFNPAAFEPASSFNFYYGKGARVTNVRGFGYHNEDFGIHKNTHLTEKVTLQIRAEAFNVFNWHTFGGSNTNIASPNFGLWNGGVSAPRNLQLGAKLIF